MHVGHDFHTPPRPIRRRSRWPRAAGHDETCERKHALRVDAESGHRAETICVSQITMFSLTPHLVSLTPNFSWVCHGSAIPFNRFNGF